MALVVSAAVTVPFMGGSEVSASSHSAGFVTPFTVQGGKYRYLLTQESGGPDKGKWDAFGGRRDENDVDALATAVREFDEESMGLLPRYATRSYVEQHSVKPKFGPKVPYSYVPYIPEHDLMSYAKNFPKNRAMKLKQKAPGEYLEKSAAGWVSDRELRRAVKAKDEQITLDIVQKDGTLRAAKVRLRKHTTRILDGKLPEPGKEMQYESRGVNKSAVPRQPAVDTLTADKPAKTLVPNRSST